MNPTDKLNLPSRLRESTFKQYEKVIAHAVVTMPHCFIQQQEQVKGSLATFASRLRDAMASLATYRWESEIVNMDKFEELYPLIKVSHIMPDRVVIGSAEAIKLHYQQNLPPNQFECFTSSTQASVVDSKSIVNETTLNASVIVSLSQDTHDAGVELKFLADLAALRLLNSVVEIKISAEQAQYLEDNFDVVLTKVNDNTYTMQ